MTAKSFKDPFYFNFKGKIKPADPNGYYANRNKKVKYKAVYRFDLDGNFICEIRHCKSLCDEAGINYNGVRLAMQPTWSDKRRLLSSMGSIWILKDDYSKEELDKKVQEKKLDPNANPKANKRSRRVKQICSTTNEVIQIWDSVNQAGRVERTGYNLSCICKALNVARSDGKRRTYAGCYWEYEM